MACYKADDIPSYVSYYLNFSSLSRPTVVGAAASLYLIRLTCSSCVAVFRTRRPRCACIWPSYKAVSGSTGVRVTACLCLCLIQLPCTCVQEAPLNLGVLVDGGSTGLSSQLFALLRPRVSLPSAHSLPVSPKQSADYPMVGFVVTNHWSLGSYLPL